jgi:hypothetical protein
MVLKRDEKCFHLNRVFVHANPYRLDCLSVFLPVSPHMQLVIPTELIFGFMGAVRQCLKS